MSDTYQSDKIFSYLIDSNKMVSQALSQFFKDNQPYMESIAKFQRSYQQVLSSTINMSAINQIAKLYTQPHFQAIQNALQSYQKLQDYIGVTHYNFNIPVRLLTSALEGATEQIVTSLDKEKILQDFTEETNTVLNFTITTPVTLNIEINQHVDDIDKNQCRHNANKQLPHKQGQIDEPIMIPKYYDGHTHTEQRNFLNKELSHVSTYFQALLTYLTDPEFLAAETASLLIATCVTKFSGLLDRASLFFLISILVGTIRKHIIKIKEKSDSQG